MQFAMDWSQKDPGAARAPEKQFLQKSGVPLAPPPEKQQKAFSGCTGSVLMMLGGGASHLFCASELSPPARFFLTCLAAASAIFVRVDMSVAFRMDIIARGLPAAPGAAAAWLSSPCSTRDTMSIELAMAGPAAVLAACLVMTTAAASTEAIPSRISLCEVHTRRIDTGAEAAGWTPTCRTRPSVSSGSRTTLPSVWPCPDIGPAAALKNSSGGSRQLPLGEEAML
mmetsp:Transcript_115823/g.328237  ORF Transcript_115823/g.328237 Transcript_115823/m.328237 type:complete len:226 (-) Transcript_115823:12-689(-)